MAMLYVLLKRVGCWWRLTDWLWFAMAPDLLPVPPWLAWRVSGIIWDWETASELDNRRWPSVYIV